MKKGSRTIVILAAVFLLTIPAVADVRVVQDPEDGWLNLRSGPSTDYPIIARVDNGTAAVELSRGGNWSQVSTKLPDTTAVGWLYRPYTAPAEEFALRYGHNGSGSIDFTFVEEARAFCSSIDETPLKEEFFSDYNGNICRRIFYCGEAGCDPIHIEVFVNPGEEASFRASLRDLQITDFGLCEALYATGKIDGLWSTAGQQGMHFCLLSVPGYEIENSLVLLRNPSVRLVRRPGGEAGSPPAMVFVARDVFYRLRGGALGDLHGVVIASLENLLGRSCTTDNQITCNIFPSNGRIVVEVVAPNEHLTGRPDHWGRAYLEIYPHSSGDRFEIYFEMPITSLRRWPANATKPTIDSFQPVDTDDGFAAFRNALMSNIARRYSGEVHDTLFLNLR